LVNFVDVSQYCKPRWQCDVNSPYQFDEKEKANFDKLWDLAHTTARETRDQFPDATLMFGNGNPQLMEEFLRRSFSKELFDARGNEAGVFMRMPEAQPFDFVANNAGLWMDRQILNHYGYDDKPIWQCYEITYPGANPGNLSQRTQAAYFVRHAMHSLAWGIPVIRQGIITDVGNSYYYSNWGSSGFCHAIPEINPKPAYVAVATMTQQLDGASFSRVIEMPSPTTFAVEFKKPKSGGFVTVMWTVRGTREVIVSPGSLDVIDLMGNSQPVTSSEKRASLSLTPEPIFGQWRHTGDGIVHYPIKLTRVIVETPQKVLRVKKFEPVARPEIYLKDLMVTYRPPEEAFVAE
jgi:hypothetical protein